MISQYLGRAPNSIIFFGANLIVTVVWNSENCRALRGAIDKLGDVIEGGGYTIIGWVHTWVCQTEFQFA